MTGTATTFGRGPLRAASGVLLALLAVAGAGEAAAQTYPTRAIKIIVPFPAGGNPDIASRIVGDELSKALKQPVVIENRPGANGGIGTSAVAKAEPDGHTLLGGNLGVLGINPGVYDKLLYDPVKDFVPISRFVVSPLLLIASRDAPFDSVASLVALARKEPGKLTFSSSGNGSASHMAGVLLNQLAGTDITHVPYRGTGAATTDVATGNVSIAFGGQGASWSLVASGRVRALALTGDARAADHPETPTVSESGVPGYQIADWTGLLAPAGTPRAIVDTLNELVGKALRDPAIAKKLGAQGLEPAAGTPEEFAAFIAAEQKKWADVARKAGVRVE
jgi:tripartite-type tricarboxylate transporter receptor subunit TctC